MNYELRFLLNHSFKQCIAYSYIYYKKDTGLYNFSIFSSFI